MEKLTFSMENYLEAVYELSVMSGGTARVSDIAARMGVSKASVNNAMNVLAQRGLLENEKYREICLTEEGRNVGRMTAGKHAVLFRLLRLLGVDEQTADEDACAIEHVVSLASIHQIYSFLEKQGIDALPERIEAQE
jgi:Mn-dependent transcriptional regulator